jgi:anti-sigma factor (TIGR02949 family)
MTMSSHAPSRIDCEEALRRLAEFLDRELADAAATEVEQHLETCRSCFSRAEFERHLKVRLSELREDAVDPDFESRICDLARGFTTS